MNNVAKDESTRSSANLSSQIKTKAITPTAKNADSPI